LYYKVTGINNLFEGSFDVQYDATLATNGSKFLNMQRDHRLDNCRAKVNKVQSQERIGIYAMGEIKAGEELTFDYGGNFDLDNK